MTDRRGMQARRERKLRRETELRRLNDTYTSEVLEDESKGKEDSKA
jgi:hypothetical protein